MKNLLSTLRFIDLTHTLTGHVPSWDGQCGFYSHIVSDYKNCATETKFRVHKLELFAGIGTHIDAPRHCFSTGKAIADIPLDQLFVPCVVIDIPINSPENYRLSPQDILDFEKTKVVISKGAFVMVRTGWGNYWNDPVKYRNGLTFPTISREAAQLLLERDIAGVGIDTLSPDIPSNDFPVHNLILGAGKYIVENVANIHLMPSYGGFACIMPIKISNGTEAPIRLVGIVD